MTDIRFPPMVSTSPRNDKVAQTRELKGEHLLKVGLWNAEWWPFGRCLETDFSRSVRVDKLSQALLTMCIFRRRIEVLMALLVAVLASVFVTETLAAQKVQRPSGRNSPLCSPSSPRRSDSLVASYTCEAQSTFPFVRNILFGTLVKNSSITASSNRSRVF